MKIKFKETCISLFSIIMLSYFFYFSINYFFNKDVEIINFIDSKIHEELEIEITNNLDNINNFLKEYSFIEYHLIKKKKNKIFIQLKIKKPFAINNLTNEVIFTDNTTAPVKYFKPNFLDSINLIDISQNSIYVNNYLNEYYELLSSLFEIVQIEYIDDRRYNLVLRNGRVVMLPKVIDSKLLYFIKNNIDLIDINTNYTKFLDLRNFHNKTIRLK